MKDIIIRPGTIFITGLSASGKSTMGMRLRDGLLNSGIKHVKLLDGEDVREELARKGEKYGFTTEDRNKVAIKIAEMASEYNGKGAVCIMCSICHVRGIRQKIRSIVGNIMEVYLDCPANICAERDRKGHYKKAFEGLYDNFIGVTEEYQCSDNVELILNTGNKNADECSAILLKKAIDFFTESKVCTRHLTGGK